MRGHNPEWANLPRRKCDDCGKNYKPKQPLREGTRGFCSDNCRKSYHKHGGAYRKLKVEMLKLVAREMAGLEKRLRQIVWEELTRAGQPVAECPSREAPRALRGVTP
jgi:hypothetical protein